MDKDWTGLGLAAASMIPFVPSGMRKINKKFKQIPSVHKDTQQLLDAKFQELDKLAQRKADYGNEQYRILKRFDKNTYFTDNEKNFIINYLIECLVDNQPFDCSSLGPNKYLNE